MIARPALLLFASLAFGPAQPSPSDPLLAVRQLYAAADYEAALAEADRAAAGIGEHGRPDLERYRALCYIALGRVDQAETAIEQVFRSDPAYRPGDEEPPRVRAAFAAVRARVLPGIVRAAYADAKASYDRKDYAAAISNFERTLGVLDLLDSVDPALGDLRTLAAGFLDLSRAASAPPATTVPQAAPEREAAPAAAAADPPAEIIPPQVISQVLPPWEASWSNTRFLLEFRGAVEVIIDESGSVTSAKVIEPVHPAYDPLLLKAAARWRYAPARQNGKPVTSSKRVEVVLRPRD